MSRVARLGAFIVTTLAILAIGVFIIGSHEYLFHSTYKLNAQFDNVVGLENGADVQVGGVHSGTVHSIQLPHTTDGKVTVVMELDSSTHEIIKRDSIASIETQGALGNQYVAISIGTAQQGEVKDGDTIQSTPPLQLADLFKKASAILDSSKVAMVNATQATAHLSSVSAKIDAGQGTVGALVNDKQLYDNLQQTSATLNATMVQAQIGVTDFQENMEALKHNFLLKGYFKKRGYEDSSDLATNSIITLPTVAPVKSFSFTGKQLFGSNDSAEMKNEKVLNPSGTYLEKNPFGFAVIVVTTGMEGDTQKDLLLSEARAMVVREYLVNNFGFDDTQIKTLGQGKRAEENPDDWGSVQVLIFPTGTEMPLVLRSPGNSTSQTGLTQKVQGIKQQ